MVNLGLGEESTFSGMASSKSLCVPKLSVSVRVPPGCANASIGFAGTCSSAEQGFEMLDKEILSGGRIDEFLLGSSRSLMLTEETV